MGFLLHKIEPILKYFARNSLLSTNFLNLKSVSKHNNLINKNIFLLLLFTLEYCCCLNEMRTKTEVSAFSLCPDFEIAKTKEESQPENKA